MGRITKRTYTSLLAWREDAQLSQAEAAARFGVTQAMWSRYEDGLAAPRPKLAQKIAAGTGVRLEIVLGIDTETGRDAGELPKTLA
jgi:transcriptional regulator with XRE-family HTH domain